MLFGEGDHYTLGVVGARHCRPRGPRLHVQEPQLHIRQWGSPTSRSGTPTTQAYQLTRKSFVDGWGIEPALLLSARLECGTLIHYATTPYYLMITGSYLNFNLVFSSSSLLTREILNYFILLQRNVNCTI